ncbi:VWA domain-containing protein [Opitutus sp. ER46]|uniref:VWA domain-containing protein n=1 Tax=Opitutus sp. ER46 TaxID=2161864 RepID=UPI000D30256D|nr:VWA domain-containing protein [Opitutus sp. ER46]PTX91686.1 hypothetical protein DB354_17630 [Opitutus sp. ER46]
MSFAWPQLLWLLLLPVAMLAWELGRRRRLTAAALHPKILRAEVGTHALDLVSDPGVASRQRLRPWLLLGLAFAIVAIARPQWGRIEEPMLDQSREIILALDLSRSMLAPDVKPSRLERSKLLIQALLEKLKGERVGLVVFSGTAFLQSPLSADYEILREFLPALKPEFLPEGGTNYTALIDTTLDAFGGSGAADRFLIILSDGEALDSAWQARVETLKKKGVRVIGLGVGTPGGSMIPDGSGGFVKDDRGAVVLSRLESDTLQQLAQATGGQYRDASAWVDLANLVEETVNAGRKGAFTEMKTVRLVDRFQWPLAFALWCFLVSFYYEFPVRPRPREISLRGTPPDGDAARKRAAPGPAAGAALLLLGLGLALGTASRVTAQVKIAPPPPPASPAGKGSAEPPALAKIVGRLATADRQSARDWADMAGATVSWGTQLQSSQGQVPAGPVNDALRAVELGRALDPKVTDWDKLREQLEALLQRPDQKPPPEQQKQQQQKQQQQNQDQSKQNPSQQDQPPKQDPQQQNQEQKQPPEQKPDEQKNDSSPSPQNSKPDTPPKDQPPAFGDMKQPPPPPPPSKDTQKVGGAPEKRPTPEQQDPNMAVPLEKLEQLKNQDSPAELFQLMQAPERRDQKKPKKDW